MIVATSIFDEKILQEFIDSRVNFLLSNRKDENTILKIVEVKEMLGKSYEAIKSLWRHGKLPSVNEKGTQFKKSDVLRLAEELRK